MPPEEEAHPLASPAPEPPAPGPPALGPHVVGQRIVVRRLLPGSTGPSGGPAFTDLLGICLSFTSAGCVVAPQTGPPVTIPLADIVSGKPVPPRPSVRHRISARDAELRVARLFPGLSVEPLGEWVLRSDPAPVGRLFKRANSCLALGSPGLPVEEAAGTVVEWYVARDRDPLVQVEAASEVESALVSLGWSALPHGEAQMRIGSVSRVLRGLGRGSGASGVTGRAVVAPESSAERCLAVVPGGLAEGRAVLDGDWLGIHDLRVRLDHRRRGLAREVMATLLDWGASQGALTAWLHVETDNLPAMALYDALGLAPHHVVRYLSR